MPTEVKFTEEERQLLVMLVSQAFVRIKWLDDPDNVGAREECLSVLRKLEGVDTVIIAHRGWM